MYAFRQCCAVSEYQVFSWCHAWSFIPLMSDKERATSIKVDFNVLGDAIRPGDSSCSMGGDGFCKYQETEGATLGYMFRSL